MQIEIKGRNVAVSEQVRTHADRRFAKVGRQVSEFARLELELSEERNPAIAEPHIAEATLHLKGVTLRATEHARDAIGAMNLVCDELARQVKRHREKRRRRREARAASPAKVSPVL